MKITCIGGGPGGLYFSILMKKAFPKAEITIYERNKPDDTFGWGVVFSAETLGHFEDADWHSYHAITESFRYWDDIETYYGGTCVRTTGHGFCGMSRKLMLQLLHKRCAELEIPIHFETEISDIEATRQDCDLLIGCDGINSLVRETYQDSFKPALDWRKCRFTWLGTDLELEAFTFVYRENQHGLFQVHAYPFDDGLSTWIVECHEDVWRRAGLDKASEEETVAYCTELFKEDLRGHKLLTNRSIWRAFPTVTNENWVHKNAVIIGDAAHTAHF
ncbi:MAG: FAD-dependent monooxygenase, partial [Planctomycetes bacterium]|nr:FAD-dependent monooxygenase [Planctomycetota bacterium]